MKKIQVWPQEPKHVDGRILVSADIEWPDGEKKKLWYELPSEFEKDLTKTCDPFTLAAAFPAMEARADLIVHGEVSPSLLANLEEFQAVWNGWRPEIYSVVDIQADREKEQIAPVSERSVAAFSGGVDACFTIYRHRKNLAGRRNRNVEAGLFVHGFDIPTRDEEAFARASKDAGKLLASLSAPLITVKTNCREDFCSDWEDQHGAALASTLSLFQGGFSAGLIGSSGSYPEIRFPWGSTPMTDILLSSDSFRIVHDGAGYTRIEKIRHIGEWEAARKHLRVCWQGRDKDQNCGSCEKCIRTILSFRALGLGLPECFERDVTDPEIRSLVLRDRTLVKYLNSILKTASENGMSEASWTNALRVSIRKNKGPLQRLRFISAYRRKHGWKATIDEVRKKCLK